MLNKFLLTLLISVSYHLAIAVGVPAQVLAKRAPRDYIVKTQDTVLGLATKYLRQIGYWPQLLGVKRIQEIKLYPGDHLHLLANDGSYQLVVNRGQGYVAYEKLQPQVREEPLSVLPPLSARRLKAMFNRPLLIESTEFESLPLIVAGDEVGALYYSVGDLIYVKGANEEVNEQVAIISKFRQLIDPDTAEELGYEVRYAGEGVVEQIGRISSVRITTATSQIGVLDRIIPLPEQIEPDIIPHKAEQIISGKVIALYDALTSTAENNTVVINRGARDGVAIGQVYDVSENIAIADPTTSDEATNSIILPPKIIGEILVYKVYDKVAFGLVTDSSQPVMLNSIVQSQR